jgi:tetratricopeptide (TPR) repeat protein
VTGGLLGFFLQEDEDPEAANDASPAESQVSDPGIAMGMAMDLSRDDPEVARKTAAFIQSQTDLLRMQQAQFKEELQLRLRHLHGQSREGALRRISQRVRLGTQVFALVFTGVIALAVCAMVRDAMRANAVIVDPFDAPPALAARGFSGTVVAGGLLDELTRLQMVTRSSAAKRNLASAWTEEIKVQVPGTGVSVSDIDRLLRAHLGHDLHVGGDLVQTDDGGLTLTVRGAGAMPKRFAGPASSLGVLTTRAAEYIFGQSQPYLFALYLWQNNRNADAIAFCREAFASVSDADKPYMLKIWANALVTSGGSLTAALQLYRQALTIKPDYWSAYDNLMNVLWLMGDEESAWRTGVAMQKQAGGRPGRAPEIQYENWDTLTWNLQAWRASMQADADADAQGGTGTGSNADAPILADIDARLHDPGGAEFQLQIARESAADPTVAALTHFVHGRLAAEAGDVTRAETEMAAFGAANADPLVSSQMPGYTCWIAPVEQAAGHPERADAVLKAATSSGQSFSGGGHFVDCARFQGDILDARGDWAGAQRAYADSVAVAPDLPASYLSWGQALARHGDLPGAAEKFATAHARGPHWADPLKAWGDVLMRQGDGAGAMAKYREASTFAPNWAALQRVLRGSDASR